MPMTLRLILRPLIAALTIGLGGLLAPGGAAAASPSEACDPSPSVALGQVPTYDSPYAAYTWEGQYQAVNFTFPSAATGACLSGTVFAPTGLAAGYPDDRFGSQRPAIVIGPGSGPGVQSMYQWAARDLAGHGYIAVTIDPQGVGHSATLGNPPCDKPAPSDPTNACPGVPFQQAGNYVDAIETGIDFLTSQYDPFAASVDAGEIGAAGHSLSARAVSYAQMIDSRIKAIVAWDNLASNLSGDAGAPSGGGGVGDVIGGELPGASVPITPKVPALGEASDARGASEPTNSSPSQKETAYGVWRAAGEPAMEVVFKGASHDDWAQDSLTTSSGEAELEEFEYYTRAWFDRWLLGDSSADIRLLATSVDGQPLSSVLSSTFYSGAFFDGTDCGNLLSCLG
jgi:hypothetical protein